MIKKSTLAITIVLLMFSLFYSGTANANPVSDWQDRKYVRENWKVGQDEVTSKELDRVLNSKYPDANFTWREMVHLIRSTEIIIKESRQNKTEAALAEALDYIKKKPVEFAVNKSLDAVKLGFIGEAYGWYQLLQQVNVGANNTALANQITLYNYAREAGITHKAIVEQTADGVEFDYNGKGWILLLEQHFTRISPAGIPTNMTSQQAWQIAKFLWDMKSNAASFDKEKKNIGEKFYAVATDPTDVLKTYFMYVISSRVPDFKNGAISNQAMIDFAIEKEILDGNIHDIKGNPDMDPDGHATKLDNMLHKQHHSSTKGNFKFSSTGGVDIGKIHRSHIESGAKNFFGKKVNHSNVIENNEVAWKYMNGYYVGSWGHNGFRFFPDMIDFNVRQIGKNKFKVLVESKTDDMGVAYSFRKQTAIVVRKISPGPFPKVSYSIIEHKNLGTRSVER